jgi:hypothetical protein
METLKLGMKGGPIERWQTFIAGQGFPATATGVFDDATAAATRQYQKARGLKDDGSVGNLTLAKAMADGFALVADTSDSDDKGSQFYPARPAALKVPGDGTREHLFGQIPYKAAPTSDNAEGIEIQGGWVKENIVRVKTPALAAAALGVRRPKAQGGKAVDDVEVHRLIADQFAGLIAAWSGAGLLDRLRTWNGSFVPRFKRGKIGELSSHSWGTAFDVNMEWNRLNVVPALVGAEGSVRELVSIANAHGFYWGGHFSSRLDGMHFECAALL